MGTKAIVPQGETADAIALRKQLSDVIRDKRRKRRQIFAAMTYRVLSTDEYSNISMYTESTIIMNGNFDVVFLPEIAIMTVLSYITVEYSRLLLVSPMWYIRIHESFDDALRHAENSFILVHSNLLLFEKSYTCSSKIKTVTETGIRIDRVILAEVLPALAGHTIKIRYNY
jgi:hypothetical protein